jgi:hypothetical protein
MYKKKWGKAHMIDWVAVAAIVPGRTTLQCYKRWHNTILSPSIALAAGRPGKWMEEEDLKLKNSVQMHGGKDWAAIAALVPGRSVVLNPRVALTAGRPGKWGEDEEIKLKGARYKCTAARIGPQLPARHSNKAPNLGRILTPF